MSTRLSHRHFIYATVIGIGLAAHATSAMAQSGVQPAASETSSGVPGVTIADRGARIIYDEVYFAQFNVVNAEDQIKRVPGVEDVLAAEQSDVNTPGNSIRGFGTTGDQILINGRRLSGKTNDIASALRRIQARQVARIEVIRGSVAGLDVRSEGTIVNVVLKGTLVTGYGSWEANYSHYTGGDMKPGGQVSYAGDIGALNYLVSARLSPAMERAFRDEYFFTPGGTQFERQNEFVQEEADNIEFTATGAYTFTNGDKFNLNLRYADEGETEYETSDQYRIAAGAPDAFIRYIINTEDIPRETWEIGGDYEHAFASGAVFSGLFVYNTFDFAQDNTFTTIRPNAAGVLDRLEFEDQDVSEKIVRGSYQWGVAQGQTAVIGAEVAINTVDKAVSLQELVGGTLAAVPVFNPDSKVKEKRFESFGTYTWQPQTTLLLEAGGEIEASKISQDGTDVTNDRSFFYVRPRLDVRYDMTELAQVRARFQRTVSQLNFELFTASFTSDDNRIGTVNSGNPELVPEKAWVYEVTYEQRLPQDRGLLSLRGFYNDVQDRSEAIPVLIEDENGVVEEISVPGNIGSGYYYGVELRGSLRLGWLGIDGGRIEGNATLRDSSVTDPFTGETRDFSNFYDTIWSAGYRQDLNWYGLSYGFTVSRTGPRQAVDRDFINHSSDDPDTEAFLEFKPFGELTARLEVEEVFRSKSFRERFQYVGSREDDVLLRREERDVKPNRAVRLILRGVF